MTDQATPKPSKKPAKPVVAAAKPATPKVYKRPAKASQPDTAKAEAPKEEGAFTPDKGLDFFIGKPIENIDVEKEGKETADKISDSPLRGFFGVAINSLVDHLREKVKVPTIGHLFSKFGPMELSAISGLVVDASEEKTQSLHTYPKNTREVINKDGSTTVLQAEDGPATDILPWDVLEKLSLIQEIVDCIKSLEGTYVNDSKDDQVISLGDVENDLKLMLITRLYQARISGFVKFRHEDIRFEDFLDVPPKVKWLGAEVEKEWNKRIHFARQVLQKSKDARKVIEDQAVDDPKKKKLYIESTHQLMRAIGCSIVNQIMVPDEASATRPDLKKAGLSDMVSRLKSGK